MAINPGKRKFASVQAMKTCWGVKLGFPLSFTLKVDECDWLASGTSRFSARKTAQVILYIEASWAPPPSSRCGGEVKLLFLLEIEPRFVGFPARSLVTTTNTVLQLLYPSS